MREKHSNITTIGLGLLLLTTGAYLGAYLALLQQSPGMTIDPVTDVIQYQHFYRLGGDGANWLFRPLNHLDRRIRPHHWRPAGRPFDYDYYSLYRPPHRDE